MELYLNEAVVTVNDGAPKIHLSLDGGLKKDFEKILEEMILKNCKSEGLS